MAIPTSGHAGLDEALIAWESARDAYGPRSAQAITAATTVLAESQNAAIAIAGRKLPI